MVHVMGPGLMGVAGSALAEALCCCVACSRRSSPRLRTAVGRARSPTFAPALGGGIWRCRTERCAQGVDRPVQPLCARLGACCPNGYRHGIEALDRALGYRRVEPE